MISQPVKTLLQPLLVAGMVACVAFTVMALVQANVESWDGTYLGLFCSLVALEAFFSYLLFQRRSLHIYGGTRFRLVECAVLLAVLQIVVDIHDRHAPLAEGLPRFDPLTLLLFVPVFLSWQAATATAADLREVWDPALRLPNSGSPIDRLSRRFFAGGFILFVAFGLMQAQNAEPLRLGHAAGSGPVVNVMLYFILGMVMLGQVHYGSLQGRWRYQGAVLSPALTSRWVRYSALFLGSVALVTFLLPTGYAGLLLDAARGESQSILAAIGERLAHLLANLGISSHPTVPPPPALPRRPPPHLVPPHGTTAHAGRSAPTDFRLIRVILFWLATIAVAIYLVRGYLEQQRIQIRLPQRLGLLGRLIEQFRSLLDRWLGRTRRFARRIVPAMRRTDKHQLRAARFTADLDVRRARSPRARIVRYFLSIVERGERQGIPRAPSDTPLELERRITLTVPESQEDMTALTRAYLEARYSDHQIGGKEADAARGPWERVRTALRALRSGG